MAKRKPTAKNIRQGQTVYTVDYHFHIPPPYTPNPTIIKFFLYSQKEPFPQEGSIIERMPITLLRRSFEQYGNKGWYFSRRQAETERKNYLAINKHNAIS